MRRVLPMLLALIGLVAGAGLGHVMRPEPPPATASDPGAEPSGHGAEPEGEGAEYVKINNQFVVTVIKAERVSALVVMSISLDIAPGHRADVYQHEPRLRDAFLQVLFDHANTGGFDGTFTTEPKMQVLRTGLTEAARLLLGDVVRDVLITDIARQDV